MGGLTRSLLDGQDNNCYWPKCLDGAGADYEVVVVDGDAVAAKHLKHVLNG